ACGWPPRGSGPGRPWRGGRLLHSGTCASNVARSAAGGRRIRRTRAKARRNTGGGVCTKIAAVVPRITITNAAADHSEPSPAPLRMLPPTRATTARSRPMRLRMSMVWLSARVKADLSATGACMAARYRTCDRCCGWRAMRAACSGAGAQAVDVQDQRQAAVADQGHAGIAGQAAQRPWQGLDHHLLAAAHLVHDQAEARIADLEHHHRQRPDQ